MTSEFLDVVLATIQEKKGYSPEYAYTYLLFLTMGFWLDFHLILC